MKESKRSLSSLATWHCWAPNENLLFSDNRRAQHGERVRWTRSRLQGVQQPQRRRCWLAVACRRRQHTQQPQVRVRRRQRPRQLLSSNANTIIFNCMTNRAVTSLRLGEGRKVREHAGMGNYAGTGDWCHEQSSTGK